MRDPANLPPTPACALRGHLRDRPLVRPALHQSAADPHRHADRLPCRRALPPAPAHPAGGLCRCGAQRRAGLVEDLAGLSAADWADYEVSIVAPNRDPATPPWALCRGGSAPAARRLPLRGGDRRSRIEAREGIAEREQWVGPGWPAKFSRIDRFEANSTYRRAESIRHRAILMPAARLLSRQGSSSARAGRSTGSRKVTSSAPSSTLSSAGAADMGDDAIELGGDAQFGLHRLQHRQHPARGKRRSRPGSPAPARRDRNGRREPPLPRRLAADRGMGSTWRRVQRLRQAVPCTASLLPQHRQNAMRRRRPAPPAARHPAAGGQRAKTRLRSRPHPGSVAAGGGVCHPPAPPAATRHLASRQPSRAIPGIRGGRWRSGGSSASSAAAASARAAPGGGRERQLRRAGGLRSRCRARRAKAGWATMAAQEAELVGTPAIRRAARAPPRSRASAAGRSRPQTISFAIIGS